MGALPFIVLQNCAGVQTAIVINVIVCIDNIHSDTAALQLAKERIILQKHGATRTDPRLLRIACFEARQNADEHAAVAQRADGS